MQKIIVVAGPTASGKSDFAVELAKQVNGEIISADSRQIYKGLNLGTGKITQEEMKGIQHHMLDIISPGENFSVADYQKLARPIIEAILTRGETPIICGGTGQYIDALIYDTIFPTIPPLPEFRKELGERSVESLYEELKEKDPRRAESIDPHNKVRLVRALEIIHREGIVPELEEPKLLYDIELYLMHPSKEALRDRIERRLEKRLRLGMIDEVKQLTEKGFSENEMKRFGLEYVTIAKYLEGKLSLEDMKQELITKTLQYAKRQDTWNKKYLPLAKLVEVT